MAGTNLSALDLTGTKNPFTMVDGTLYATNAQITNLTVDSINITTAVSLVAHVGGGQALGTLVAADYNVFTTVASNFDSALLPVTSLGKVVIIKNTSANILSVFPQSGSSINGLGANASIDIPAGGQLEFTASTATAWGTPRSLYVSSNTAQTGGISVQATANSANYLTKITNVAQGQSSTLTIPDVGTTAGTFAMTSGANLFVADTKRVTAQVDATTTTLANVTGLSFTVVPGTYTFKAYLPVTCGGTGGVKLAFNYTTAVLSSISATAYAYTAAAIAVSSTTTTTTQTSIVASNTAFTSVVLEGTMIVTTGGTVALQFAENSANATSSVLVNGNMTFVRIG